jgi:hypothetical protein
MGQSNKNPNSIEALKSRIYTLRGVNVMLDRDLAALYSVTTGNLNKAVKRNQERFPSDFMFQLDQNEIKFISRFQYGSLKQGQNIKYLPHAFTEQGVAMLSTALKSKIAIEMNICIMRTFIELRHQVLLNPEYDLLKEKIRRIESRVEEVAMIQKIDTNQQERKLINLSTQFHHLSETLDQFQDTHIIIKRPDETPNE